MFWYVLASLAPVLVLVPGALFGGVWAGIALGYITCVVIGLDRWTQVPLPADEGHKTFTTRLSVGLALTHFALLALAVWALVQSRDTPETIALFMAMGLYFGQVSNSNAHELIHNAARGPRRLGVAVFSSLLFGHHASAHPLVHHVWVASAKDPNSARVGMGFYRFWPRAWIGSFRTGWRAENLRRARRTPPPSVISHPYLGYGLASLLSLVAAWMIGGSLGVFILVLLAIYAQAQLILSDYVQHYGLRRRVDTAGRLEPVGPQHAWNAKPWFSSAMMLNAPRHSDHHQHPARDFAALRLANGMPMLPYSFPVMGALATVPPLWRRVMDHRVAKWAQKPAPGGVHAGDLAHSRHEKTHVDSALPDQPAPFGGHPSERRGV
ncbi:MAG: alkane 1-monooxygenase [Sedimentitalea sp.]